MNNAGTLFLILLGTVALLLLGVSIPVIKFYIAVGCLVLALILAVITVRKLHRHSQLKEYFWNVMSNPDKEFVNYVFTRKMLGKPGKLDKLFGINRERDFQQQRNEKLLQYNHVKGIELIKLEREINNLLPIMLIALQIGAIYIMCF